ncbi:MAG: hypothetical protein QF600_10580 [Verrucomicrobiota bacterium]|jgi:hypothetical protein|nr:hypothetical protein [Verrucomicrobiota bacterium]
MESSSIESVVAASRQTSATYFGEFLNDTASQPAGMLQSGYEHYVSQVIDNSSDVESSSIVSKAAAARQSSQMALGQIVDNMAEVSSTDAVDQTLELFLNDIVKSTIVAHSSEETDGLYRPLIDILA